ncbi:MAG: cupredoxin domain-containing protein [Actinomycetota bacterium]
MGRKRYMAAAAASLFVVGAACGGGGGEAGGDGGSTVEVSATDSVFSPTNVSVPSGEVTLRFVNNGTLQHNLTIDSLGVDSGIIEPGDSKEVSFTAPDGATEFICTIHLASDDMKGTITPA